MTDFSEISDAALNRLIAEARGWTIHNPIVGIWQLRAPDDSVIVALEEELRLWDNVPQWTNDLNLAWELFTELRAPYGKRYSLRSDGTIVLRNTLTDGPVRTWYADGNAARAICEVWCEWHKEQTITNEN